MDEKEKKNSNLENTASSKNVEEKLNQEPIYQVSREEETKNVETFDNKSFTTISKKSKKKKKTPIFIVLFLIIILGIAYGIFSFITTKPGYVFIKSLNQLTDSMEVMIKPLQKSVVDIDWDTVSIKTAVNMKVTSPYLQSMEQTEEIETFNQILEKINQTSMKTEIQNDEKNKKFLIGVTLLNQEDELFNAVSIVQDNRQYLLLKGALEKYLELEEEINLFDEKENETLEEDATYVWNFIKNSFQKNIKDSYITKENAKVKLDGKMVNTQKITLVLNQKNETELLTNIVKDLKADKRASEFMNRIYPEFKNYEVKEVAKENEFYYAVYITKGLHKVVKTSIYKDDIAFNYTREKNGIYEVVQDGKAIVKATLVDEEDGFSLKMEDLTDSKTSLEIKGKNVSGKAFYTLNLADEETSIDVIISDEIKKQSEQLYQANMEIKITIKEENEELLNLKLTADSDVSKEVNIEEVKDSIAISQLTEEDLTKIQNYLIEVVEKIMQ